MINLIMFFYRLKKKLKSLFKSPITTENKIILKDIEQKLNEIKAITQVIDRLMRDLYYHKMLLKTKFTTLNNDENKLNFAKKNLNIENLTRYLNNLLLIIEQVNSELNKKSNMLLNNENYKNDVQLDTDFNIILATFSELDLEKINDEFKNTIKILKKK